MWHAVSGTGVADRVSVVETEKQTFTDRVSVVETEKQAFTDRVSVVGTEKQALNRRCWGLRRVACLRGFSVETRLTKTWRSTSGCS